MARKERLMERARSQIESPDQTPLEIAVENQRPPTIREQIHQAIRQELSKAAAAGDLGTFEDEDDFNEDDPDAEFLSPYEVSDMLPLAEADNPTLETLDGTDETPAPQEPLPEAPPLDPPSGNADSL